MNWETCKTHPVLLEGFAAVQLGTESLLLPHSLSKLPELPEQELQSFELPNRHHLEKNSINDYYTEEITEVGAQISSRPVTGHHHIHGLTDSSKETSPAFVPML